jgi:hypothetical protein
VCASNSTRLKGSYLNPTVCNLHWTCPCVPRDARHPTRSTYIARSTSNVDPSSPGLVGRRIRRLFGLEGGEPSV